MPKRDNRRLVSVPIETFKAIQQLQRELSAVSGKRFTVGDVVARGAQCLLDAASPACVAFAGRTRRKPLRERVRTAVMSNLIALRELGSGDRHRRNRVRRGTRCRVGDRRGRR